VLFLAYLDRPPAREELLRFLSCICVNSLSGSPIPEKSRCDISLRFFFSLAVGVLLPGSCLRSIQSS